MAKKTKIKIRCRSIEKLLLIPVASDNDGWKKKMNTYLEKILF